MKQTAPKKTTKKKITAEDFLNRLQLAPYGVVGERIGLDHKVSQVAEYPDENTIMVDPAGLKYIKDHGPEGAGGASGAIYRLTGLKEESCFPSVVYHKCRNATDAKYHSYGQWHVIHIVSPDFRQKRYDRPQLDRLLTQAYVNIFEEYDETGKPSIRIPPISGGGFAGPFRDAMPRITKAAMCEAFETLTEETQARLLKCDMKLCILGEHDYSAGLQFINETRHSNGDQHKTCRQFERC